MSKDISRLYGIPSKKIVVVGGGYDESLFTGVPKSAAGTVHILYAGKFNRSKGLPWLLRSLMKIKNHDWHLHMAGSGAGPEFSNCIELAKKLGRRVTNHGYVTHRRLSELMKMVHVQVLPSFFEGLPLVLFEGLASGCRIITTKLSGFKEIFGRAKKCFSKLANAETCDYKGSTPYELGNGQSVEDLIVRAGIAREDVKIVFVNSRKVDFDTVLADGDNVGLAPSVGGM